MSDFLRKQWTSLLGILLMLAAFIYLFKYTIGLGWITDAVIIAIGLIFATGFSVLGITLDKYKGHKLIGEMFAGLGMALLYTTFSFAGIYYGLWDSMTVFISMLAVTAAFTTYAYQGNARLLMNIGLIGALAAPLVLRPETDQVFTLFLYMLVINAAFYYISVRKSWLELRLIGFIGTWLLYIVYYFHYDPAIEGIWSMPYRYAVTAFGFYVVAFMLSSWKERSFNGLNLYLGLVNALLFGTWSVSILDGVISVAAPLAAMGLLFIIMAFIVYQLTGQLTLAVWTKLSGGVFLFLIAAAQFGQGWESKPLINVYIWAAVIVVLFIIGRLTTLELFKFASYAVWLVIVLYWFIVTWDTPRGEWFGTYIPFLNSGALAWILLAGIGFYYSTHVIFNSLKERGTLWFTSMNAVVSHLIVGGLLTVQVENLFEEYAVPNFFDYQMTLSMTWGIYALLLFLWGAYSRQRVFRIFGSIVLLLVTGKTLFFDLAGEDTIYKVIILFALGVISFFITWINNRWNHKTEVL
ncbi:MAG: DUF2339 domain-containing protein [Paenibacillaceae bacterium]